MHLIIEWKWKCSLWFFLFAVQWYRIACKWKLSHANENYRTQIKITICKENYPMRMEIVQCKWKLPHANEKKYRMQKKIIQCKWKNIAWKWKLSNVNEKNTQCKWNIVQCKWKRSNIGTFEMPYVSNDPNLVIIECKWRMCTLSNCKWKQTMVELQMKHFDYLTANETSNYEWKTIQCELKSSHANVNYQMRMKKYRM